ncbi:unnamed protein product [Ilex paraguariensis]|uniref:Uncharacterized protein n=1 Tax=Ilex paraguariensis TaxID=185542 RepID=A0ABC8R955_9AQUA
MDRLFQYYSSSQLALLNSVELPKGDVEMDDPNDIMYEHNKDWFKFLEIEETKAIKSELDRYLQDAIELLLDLVTGWLDLAAVAECFDH